MQLISFKSWMKKSVKEQKELQQHDFSDWEGVSEGVSEEKLSSTQKKDLKSLEKLLRSHDWWYSMADDGASYRKGGEEDKKIKDLMRKIGSDDAKRMWSKYAKKAGVIGTSWEQVEELSPEERKKKEIELDALLRKQQEVEDEVKKLESEIGGDQIKFTKVFVEDETKPTPDKVKSEWNKHPPFFPDKEVKKPSLFPDMDRVERNISLGVDVNENGYVLPNGGHHFADNPFDTTTKWEPPSDARKKRMNK